VSLPVIQIWNLGICSGCDAATTQCHQQFVTTFQSQTQNSESAFKNEIQETIVRLHQGQSCLYKELEAMLRNRSMTKQKS
jgi:hypothetical protein